MRRPTIRPIMSENENMQDSPVLSSLMDRCQQSRSRIGSMPSKNTNTISSSPRQLSKMVSIFSLPIPSSSLIPRISDLHHSINSVDASDARMSRDMRISSTARQSSHARKKNVSSPLRTTRIWVQDSRLLCGIWRSAVRVMFSG